MWQDPIVEEVRCNREAYAAKYNDDIKAICRAARERQKKSSHKVVSLSPRSVATTRKTDGQPAA